MTMVSHEALMAMIGRIYQSVEDPELWPDTIDGIGELVSGRRGFWTAPLGDARSPGINPVRDAHTFFFSRADLRVLDQYAGEFGELIVRFLKIIFLSILWSPNQIYGREAIGLRMAQRFLPSFESSDSAAMPSKSAMRNLIAALWEDGRPVTADSLEALRVLAPHLDRALRLQMRLGEAEIRSDMLSAALDRLTLGVVLVDRSGLPVWLNWRAQEIIDQRKGLSLDGSGLAAYDPSETRRLRGLIRSAVSTAAQGLLQISREADLRSLLVLVFPLQPKGVAAAGSSHLPCGAIFICDPDRADNPSISSLQEAFNLTYREAQTAVAVSRGQGLQAAAETMGVAVTTARSQLQQVFMKTGTRHQAELAGLVHRTLGKLRFR